MEIKQKIMMCINILNNIHTPRKSLTFLGCSSSLSSSHVTHELLVLYCIGKFFLVLNLIIIVQVFLRPYAGPIQVLFRSYLGLYQILFRSSKGLFQIFVRYPQEIRQIAVISQLDLIFKLFSCIQVFFGSFLGLFQILFRSYKGRLYISSRSQLDMRKKFERFQLYLIQILFSLNQDSLRP